MARQQEEKNLLGAAGNLQVDERHAAGRAAVKKAGEARVVADGPDSIAGLLSQLMARLRSLAEEKTTEPGEWTLSPADRDLVRRLGLEAGMDEGRLALLLQQMEKDGGRFTLADLLDVLGRNFEAQRQEKPVTVPETELPLLETLLARMGVPVETIGSMSEQAVTGDGRLDLVKLLNGLDGLEGNQPVQLTGWERGQLQDILTRAGASGMLLRSLLPEAAGQPVTLTVERLSSMLQQGLQEGKANSAQAVDFPAFLKDLNALLARTGFKTEGVGWSPVVQDSARSLYDKLVESVDLSTVQVKKVGGKLRMNPEVREDALDKSGILPDDLESVTGIGSARKTAGSRRVAAPAVALARQDGGSMDDIMPEAPGDQVPEPRLDQVLAGASGKTVHGQLAAGEVKPVVTPGVRLSPALQAQTFADITQGVVQGLKNNDHHLVLNLHPPELGEVKVHLLIRADHVAVSFAMESSKVKDVMESNMQQFQNSLEKQGFIVQGCMVSLSQGEDGGEAWRQFEESLRHRAFGGSEPVAGLPDDAFYFQARAESGSAEQGVDLFA